MHFRRFILPAFSAALVAVASCHHAADVTGVNVEYVEMNAQGNYHDSATAATIAPFKDSLDRIMNEVLAVSEVAMPKERDQPETLLGNFVADLCLRTANVAYDYKVTDDTVQLCLLNTGGLRSSLPKGPITRRNIFELMPFDNELVVLTLSGTKMQALLRYLAASPQPEAGVRMGVRPDKTPGTTLIAGAPFDSTKTYKVVTSDYLANGGDKMDFFRDPVQVNATGIKIRDAIIACCQEETAKGRTLSPKTDGRIYHESK